MITHTEILEAAIYVFAHKPDATVSDVAKKAGITRVTVNRKFGSKQKLLDQAASHCIKRFGQVLKKAKSSKKTPIEKIILILRGYYNLKDHYFFMLRIIVDDQSTHKKNYLKQLEIIEEIVIEAQECGEIRQELPPGWVASFFDFIIIAACTSRYRGVVAERDMLGIALNTLQFGISPQRAF
ncbi:MAG: TetR/AcrR family transcriptional regulator [Sneathiella sp.]